MKWLVNGANSFSGKSFCDYLNARGKIVTALARPEYDVNTRMDNVRAALEGSQPDYVVNFAALNVVPDSWPRYDDYYQTNVVGMARFARTCARIQSMKRYIHISSPEIYGSTTGAVDETHKYNPSTPYAVSKAAMDMDLIALHRATGFPVCFTRSVNVYGDGQQGHRIIPKTVIKILRGEKLELHGGGVSKRSFLHMDDISTSIIALAAHGRDGEVYHTSSGEKTSIRDLVDRICLILKRSPENVYTVAPERAGKDMEYELDCSKISREVGWSPLVNFSDGLRRTVEWVIANRKFYDNDTLEYQHRS